MFERTLKVAGYLSVELATLGLIFRFLLYRFIPVSPGEPAGLGDILDLLIFFALLIVGAFLLASGAILLLLNKKLGFRVAGLGSFVPLIYYINHYYLMRILYI